MDPLIPGQGIVCTEEIICLRIFIQDSLFTLSSVQYVYYTNVLCVHVCGRERAFVYICVCVYVCVCKYVQSYSSFPDTVHKSVHLNCSKDCNHRPTDGMRNAPIFFLCAYLISALWVLLLWHDRHQAYNPFPHISAAAELALLRWPPRSPDLPPCHVSLWDTLRALLPLPHDLL